MSWNKNTKEICIKAYSRVQMLTKLKYAGICRDDLLLIYKLFIRSVIEYCSVAFHTSLTLEQNKTLEGIQATCIKIILGHQYTDYMSALKICDIHSLEERRQQRLLKFSLKCLDDPHNKKMFPKNKKTIGGEVFKVNFARTTKYMKSTIPQAQRLLNDYFHKKCL